jgi:dynein heavy chain 2
MNRRVESLSGVLSAWDDFNGVMDSHQHVIAKQVEAIKSNLVSQGNNFGAELEKFASRWHQFKPKEETLEGGNSAAIDAGIKFVKEKRKEWDDLMVTHEKLK